MHTGDLYNGKYTPMCHSRHLISGRQLGFHNSEEVRTSKFVSDSPKVDLASRLCHAQPM